MTSVVSTDTMKQTFFIYLGIVECMAKRGSVLFEKTECRKLYKRFYPRDTYLGRLLIVSLRVTKLCNLSIGFV